MSRFSLPPTRRCGVIYIYIYFIYGFYVSLRFTRIFRWIFILLLLLNFFFYILISINLCTRVPLPYRFVTGMIPQAITWRVQLCTTVILLYHTRILHELHVFVAIWFMETNIILRAYFSFDTIFKCRRSETILYYFYSGDLQFSPPLIIINRIGEDRRLYIILYYIPQFIRVRFHIISRNFRISITRCINMK